MDFFISYFKKEKWREREKDLTYHENVQRRGIAHVITCDSNNLDSFISQ